MRYFVKDFTTGKILNDGSASYKIKNCRVLNPDCYREGDKPKKCSEVVGHKESAKQRKTL
jgi:hypothetical protein